MQDVEADIGRTVPRSSAPLPVFAPDAATTPPI